MFTLTTRSVASSRDAYNAMDALFANLASTADTRRARVVRPRIEVLERDASYEVRAELPGSTREDIAVDIHDARVTLSATVKREEPEEGVTRVYSERAVQSYQRSFDLPQAVDSTASSALFANGVLTLTLPKRELPKPTRVNIG